MSDAVAVQIAESLAKELNAGSFSQAFTATRAYVARADLLDDDQLRVRVVPKSDGISNQSRKKRRHLISFDIGFEKIVGSDAPQDVDPWVKLVEDIGDAIPEFALLDGTGAALPISFLDAVNDPIYSLTDLMEHQRFVSVITVTYMNIR